MSTNQISGLKFVVILGVVIGAGFVSSPHWFPHVDKFVTSIVSGSAEDNDHEHDDHDDHEHDDHAHGDESESLELSEQARSNLGLTKEFVQPIELGNYKQSITIPAVVAERPGRTHLEVATPMTGLVTHVHAVEGEAVLPDDLLFEIRLTHEDLVRAQTEFLKTVGDISVEEREIKRLKGVMAGAIAGKIILERQYAHGKLTSLLQSLREALRLHGLSDQQIDVIEKQRRLLTELQLWAPSPDEHSENELHLTRAGATPEKATSRPRRTSQNAVPLVIQQLHARKGQSLSAGDSVCVLADYSQLFIEGRAFESDSTTVIQALQNGWTISAQFGDHLVSDLKVEFINSEVDPNSRTLRFYVSLGNQIVRDTKNSEGQRFVTWKYRPGQRLQLHVPVAEWKQQIVLPVDAVAEEGPEAYVFQENGDHFDRVPVHVIFRDQSQVVIANDGSVFPGDVVAMRSAHQMQMALRNKSGGAVDPHHGHSH